MRAEVEQARAEDAAARRVAQTEFSRPVVLEAGAGTGKTTTLVARVVAWAMGEGWSRAHGALRERAARVGDVAPIEDDRVAARVLDGVVAITFTEAAAASMATKVGEAFTAIERGKRPVGLEPDALPRDTDVVKARARSLLGALDHLVVRTIHAFCRRLLASMPLEAGLHPRFAVDADGEEVRALAREIVEAQLRVAYAEPGDPDFLALAARGVGPQEVVDGLVALAEGAVPADALLADPLATDRVGALVVRLRDGARFVSALALPPLEDKAAKSAKNARKLAAALADLGDRLTGVGVDLDTLSGWLGELLPDNLLALLRVWGKGIAKGKAEAEALGGVIDRIAPEAAALHRSLIHLRKVDAELLALGRRVLQPLLVELHRQLRSRGVETFSALLRDARDLLVQRPDVAARLRGGMTQLLVDEFQDTDKLQCDLVRSLALEGDPSSRPGLFLVGDPKQSIYGWRSADLRAYDDFLTLVRSQGGRVCPLTVNFRSAPPILDEVERAIRPIMHEQRGLQPAFQSLVACEGRAASTGFNQAGWAPVEYWVSWELDEKGGVAETKSRDATELEARALARDLVTLHRDHQARGETFQWGSVGLLLRSVTELDVVLGALRDANVPYAVERDRSYYRRREVIDAASLVRCVLDPNDHLALLTLLRSAMVGVPDAALIPLWEAGFPGKLTELGGPDTAQLAAVEEAIEDAARSLPGDVPGLLRVAGWDQSLRSAIHNLAALRQLFETEAADRFVEELRTRFLVEATESARYLGSYRLANLDRFFRTLITAMDEGGGDPQVILRSLRASVTEAREAEEGRPKETAGNAVQVMTIHKAKGLDFDHVYLLQLHKKSGRRSGARTVAEETGGGWEYVLFGAPTLGWDEVAAQREAVEAQERVRLLYVAMTRARDRLVLAGNFEPDKARQTVELASSHAQLLLHREGDVPALRELMEACAASATQSFVDVADARWGFVGLEQAQPLPIERPAPPVLPDAATVSRHAERLAALRRDASGRMVRPLGGAASLDSHGLMREQVAERRFREEGGDEAGAAPESAERLARAERLELAVGSAVHRVLETYDLDLDPVAEMTRQRARVPGFLRTLIGGRALRAANDRAQAILDRVAAGDLLARLRASSSAIVARELPLILPPTEAEDLRSGAVAYIAGAVDLLLRDDDGLVIVDYKADRVESDAEIEARVAVYAPQAAHYARAVEDATGERPRVELWFLWCDRVVALP